MTWSWDDETLAALEVFLAGHDLLDGAPNPRPVGDGHSNLTYLIRIKNGQAVLRRPPPPPIPKGANDVLREAQVLTALCNTDVPTPEVYAVAQEGDVLDVPFYVMSYKPGPVMTDQLPAPFTAKDLPALAYGLIDGLAALHQVDWQACGLDDYGRPVGFNTRHLKRFEGLLNLQDNPPTYLSDMATWLRDATPAESGAAIIHNDFRLGNVIWAPEAPPRLLAVLDWELATLGDPLLDLGYTICCYPEPGDRLNPTQELSRAFLAGPAPSRYDLVDHYAKTTGRDVSGVSWYAAMAAWKLAVLYDYQHRLAADAYYEDATQAPRFIASAEAFAKGF
jgi:aminoglycoside phosphotransferase (APT) family kinase protein